MNEISIPNVRKGFSVFNDVINEVQIKSATIRYNNADKPSILTVNCASGEATVKYDNFYATVEDVKRGNSVEWNSGYFLTNYIERDCIDVKSQELHYWTMEGGEAVKVLKPLNELIVFFDKDGRVCDIKCPDLPDQCYASQEECYAFNDITVVHEDGSEEVVVGAANLCKLTDEQETVMSQLEELAEKARQMGIVILQDWNGMYAFNKNNIDSFIMSYEEEPRPMEFVNLRNDAFIRKSTLVNMDSDEDNLYISRKNA